MGCAEFFVALYFDVLNKQVKPFAMDGKGEDLFFLSNGHISPVFYSVLARSGYFPLSELATFRKINSRLQGFFTALNMGEDVLADDDRVVDDNSQSQEECEHGKHVQGLSCE